MSACYGTQLVSECGGSSLLCPAATSRVAANHQPLTSQRWKKREQAPALRKNLRSQSANGNSFFSSTAVGDRRYIGRCRPKGRRYPTFRAQARRYDPGAATIRDSCIGFSGRGGFPPGALAQGGDVGDVVLAVPCIKRQIFFQCYLAHFRVLQRSGKVLWL